MIKKLLAVLMAASMLAAALPVGVMADGTAYYDDSDMAGVSSIVAEASYVMKYATSDTILETDSALTYDETVTVGNSPAVAKTQALLYKVKVPDIPNGKILKTAQFRATSWWSTTNREMQYAYILPETLDTVNLTVSQAQNCIKPSTSYTASAYYIGSYESSMNDSYKYNSDTKNYYYRNRYEITEQISNCIANEQQYFYIAVTRDGTAVRALTHKASEAWCKPTLFYTIEDAPELSVTDCSIDSGATEVNPIGSADVTFSDNIVSVSATINGAPVSDSDITINGAKVSVAFELGLSQATTLVVTATDANGTTATHTVSFTTASKYAYYDDSDLDDDVLSIKASATYQLRYSIFTSEDSPITEADSAAILQTTTSNFVAGHASYSVGALYKIELPSVPEGKVIDMAQFRATSYYSNTTVRNIPFAYAFPGEDVDIDSLTVGSAAQLMEKQPLVANELNDSSYSASTWWRNVYNIEDYVNECIAAGDEYIWIVVTRPSTVKAYPDSRTESNWQPKLFYRLADAPVITEPKLVSADATGEYEALADIASISSVTKVKAAAYMANATSSDLSFKVGVAQYFGGELVSISFVPYTLAAHTEGTTVFFGVSDVQPNVDKIKAIIWDADNTPVTAAKTVES